MTTVQARSQNRSQPYVKKPEAAHTRRNSQAFRFSKLLIWAAWTCGLGVALALLLRSGGFTASTPPLHSGIEFRNFFFERDPLDIAASAGRLVAIALIGYLLIVSSVQAVALQSQRLQTRSLAARLTPRFLLFFTAGLMASTSPALAGTAAYAAEPDQFDPSTTPVMRVVESPTPLSDLQPVNPAQARTSLPWASNTVPPSAPSATSASPATAPAAPSVVTPDANTEPAAPAVQNTAPRPEQPTRSPSQSQSDSSRPRTQTSQAPTMQAQPAPQTQQPKPEQRQPEQPKPLQHQPEQPKLQPLPGGPSDPYSAAQPATPATALPTALYTVVQGDHFWGIAEQFLTLRDGTQPSAAQVARYSAEIIQLNQSALTDPENPGLIMVGQVFQLPAAS